MRKPATGEPYAGKPPVRFGGRGGQKPSLPLSVLLVEQNAFAALEMCDHAYLLEGGRIVLSGPGAEMIENEHVRKAYLGG